MSASNSKSSGNIQNKESSDSPRRKSFIFSSTGKHHENVKTPDRKSEKTHRFVKGAKLGNIRYMDLMEPTVNAENVPEPPASTVLSTATVPEGGKIVSVRDPEGKIQVRIEYERDQLIKMAASPFAALSPACIKKIVEETPELIAPFPIRHFCLSVRPFCVSDNLSFIFPD